MNWAYVIPHFTSFLSNLELTQAQRDDAETKSKSVGNCLYSAYYGNTYSSSSPKRIIVGSYGKGTAVRPPSDIDMLFILPDTEYWRFNNSPYNGQSSLLQDVKSKLVQTFPNTDIRADGQVVKIPFSTYAIDLVPAFICADQSIITCNTNDGGSWKPTNPKAEYQAIIAADDLSLNKATHLIKMLKAWKRCCNVEIKSLALEIAACQFAVNWPHRGQGLFWYDWLIRDFFAFMLKFKYGTAQIPGITEKIYLGDKWYSKCESAYQRALKACEYEHDNYGQLAADEWKKIFGDQFTKLI